MSIRNGIPAKFVIDKNGNIRFSLVGFGGSEDAAVQEIITMIELAQQCYLLWEQLGHNIIQDRQLYIAFLRYSY